MYYVKSKQTKTMKNNRKLSIKNLFFNKHECM